MFTYQKIIQLALLLSGVCGALASIDTDSHLSPKVLEKLRPTENLAYEDDSLDDDTWRSKRWEFDYQYSGISTFAHLPHVRCLVEQSEDFDIAIIGVPFDTAVSHRPGARFGPKGIRSASSRQMAIRGFNPSLNVNPYESWAKILDCGDIPVSSYDNQLAVRQMTEGYIDLLSRKATASPASNNLKTAGLAKDGIFHPRLITLGGDHSIGLASLRALGHFYGNVSVIHFDSHLDTWNPKRYYPSYWHSDRADFTHGTMFWMASKEGLINNGTSIHAGLRTRLSGTDYYDYEEDNRVGFTFIEAQEIDEIGVNGIVERIKQVVGDTLVYLSIDIDVVDPGLAPGTGTPETGGWTTREMKDRKSVV